MKNRGEENIRKNISKLRMLSPISHYPYWRYLCPHCLQFWEMREKCEEYLQVCSNCVRKMIGSNT